MIAAILTGGASTRFGSDKALAMGGVVRDAVRGAGCDPVVAVGGDAGDALGLITVPDRRPGEGPLAALASVLLWAGPERVLVLPCDLPLLRAEYLAPLLAAAYDEQTPLRTAVVAMADGSVAHSVAVWPGSVGRLLWQAVERGDRALRVALELLEWRGVEIDERAVLDADTQVDLAEHQSEAMSPHSTPHTTPHEPRH